MLYVWFYVTFGPQPFISKGPQFGMLIICHEDPVLECKQCQHMEKIKQRQEVNTDADIGPTVQSKEQGD